MSGQIDEFDLALTDAQDEATLVIKHPTTGDATTWAWIFYGPGHPKTIEVANRASREVLREQREHKQAQLNGKKIKVDEQSIDDLRTRNIDSIVSRTKEFSPVKIGNETITFSSEAARKLLADPRKGWLFSQIIDFLSASESFIQPSATS